MGKNRNGALPVADYERSDQNFLKRFNRRKVLDIFRERKTLSRIELSQIANLDKKTITNITKELLEDGQIRFDHTERKSAGRPKELLSINGSYAHCVGIDIGGSHITGVVLDFSDKLLAFDTVEIDLRNHFDSSAFFSITNLMIDNLLLRSGLSPDDISMIGIAIPGHTSKKGEATLIENIPCLAGVDIRAFFANRYNKPVLVGDCSQLMALAELRIGEGHNANDFLVFDLALGIGCGIVINRSIYGGFGGKSGEIGHMIVERDGPLCSCGRRGCIEAMASGWALSAFAKAHIEANPNGILASVSEAAGGAATTRQLSEAAAQGSSFSTKLLQRAGLYIGIGISNAISLFNPPRVILGGRLIIDNPILLDAIRASIREKTIDAIYQDTEIVVSKIGGNASAIGAALQCLDSYYPLS